MLAEYTTIGALFGVYVGSVRAPIIVVVSSAQQRMGAWAWGGTLAAPREHWGLGSRPERSKPAQAPCMCSTMLHASARLGSCCPHDSTHVCMP